MLKFLNSERSTFSIPGPRTTLRPSLPNWPACVCGFSCWNGARLTHWFAVCGCPVLGSEIRFGPAGVEAGDFGRAALQRNIGAVVDRERSAAGEVGDGVELPAVDEQRQRRATRSCQLRQRPGSAEHEAAAWHRTATGRARRADRRDFAPDRFRRPPAWAPNRPRSASRCSPDSSSTNKKPGSSGRAKTAARRRLRAHDRWSWSRRPAIPPIRNCRDRRRCRWCTGASGYCCSQFTPGPKTTGLASMKRGRCVPLLPT